MMPALFRYLEIDFQGMLISKFFSNLLLLLSFFPSFFLSFSFRSFPSQVLLPGVSPSTPRRQQPNTRWEITFNITALSKYNDGAQIKVSLF